MIGSADLVKVIEDTTLDNVSKIKKVQHINRLNWRQLPNDDPGNQKAKNFNYMLNSMPYFWSQSASIRDPKDWEDLAPQVFAVIREYIESDIVEYDNWDKYIELDNTLQNRWNETYYKYPRSVHDMDKG